MQKEFVPYELAVKLKALGFDEPCFAWYNDNGNYMLGIDEVRFDTMNTYHLNNTDSVSAPLYQQAFRWFREKYELVGVPTHQSYDIWNTITGECFIEIYPLNSYEEAELACLTKLIEIVEQQKQK
jgi:hypothetical protein